MVAGAGCRSTCVSLALLLLLLHLPTLAPAQEIRYLYDDLNRLIGVVDQQGNAAEYVYDAVGNILQIKRFTTDPSAAVSITLVSPNKGSVGTEVRIFGKGFSPTPGDNQVAFNGTAATVTAATATSLTTSVPSGATTGFITLTTLLGSATSPEPFTVPADLAIAPAEAEVVVGWSFDFQAEVGGSPAPPVTWRVNGIVGGTAAMGTISPEGLYRAPQSLPPVQPVTVEAVLTADPAQKATATVHVVALAAGLVQSPALTVRVASLSTGQTPAVPVSVAAPVAASGQMIAPPLTVTAGPVLTGVAPSSGAQGTALSLTLTGANLQGATGVTVLRDGLADSNVTVSGVSATSDGTGLTCTLTIAGTAPTGVRVLEVVTPQGSSTFLDLGTNRFTVTMP